jgi:hypothetical protein
VSTPPRPEPVLTSAVVASLATTVAGLTLTTLVVTHVLTPEGSAILGPALASAIPTVIGAVGTLAAALRARRQVTPLSAPIAASGTALIEATVEVVDAIRQATRPAGPQTPGRADHAAAEVTG